MSHDTLVVSNSQMRNINGQMCKPQIEMNEKLWYKYITLITPLGIFMIGKCNNPKL